MVDWRLYVDFRDDVGLVTAHLVGAVIGDDLEFGFFNSQCRVSASEEQQGEKR